MNRKNRLTAAAMALCMAFALPFPSIALTGQYDEETAARLQDNKLEFDEISNLLKEYNPEIRYGYDQLQFSRDDAASSVRDMRSSMEDQELKEQLQNLKRTRHQMTSVLPPAQLAEMDAGIAGMEQLLKLPSTYNKSVDDGIKDGEKELETGIRQATKTLQSLVVTYNSLLALKQTSQKAIELQEEFCAAAELKNGIGMGTETDVLTVKSSLLTTKAQLEKIEANLDTLQTNIGLATGWSVESRPEIGPAPSADIDKIASIDLESDIIKAIGNNQTLINQRHQTSKKSSSAVSNRMKNIDESEQKLKIEMERLYQQIQIKKAAYDAAQTGFEKAGLAKNAADRQYQLNMISRLVYLQAQIQFVQAEGAKKTADSSLLQAMLDYDWAVQGFVTIPD